MVPIYNGISPCQKKEGICVSPNEVDEPRAYYTEGSKSERKKQLLYTNAYIHGILKDGTNEPISRAAMETGTLLGEEGEGRSNMETHITVYKIDSQWEFAV